MSRAQRRVPGGHPKKHRKGPHHVIIARGDKVRSFALRPGRIVAAGAFAFLIAAGGVAAGAFSFFSDDLETTAVAEQARIRQEYESRIAELHRQMEALVSRHLVEQQTLNAEVAALIARQGDLIEQQQLLTGLANDALAAGIDVLPMLAPIPAANPLRDVPTGGVGGPVDPLTTGAVIPDPGVGHDEALAAVEAAAVWLGESQREALETLAEEIADRTDQLAGALETLGYTTGGDVGGPFIPADDAAAFAVVGENLAAFAELREYALRLPLGSPLTVLDVTSNFGWRRDPFNGQNALHSGVDLAAVLGTPVHATGPGRVVTAGVNGGYGKMVEIDHGNGITTIYAHLNSISVRVGDTVAAGATVGRVGSTGRSTGPHLHYEIARDGTPFNPLPHLQTGARIADLL